MFGLARAQDIVKVAKGLKTKIALVYAYVEKLGEYLKVLKEKWIYKYDEKGNDIEEAHYKPDGSLDFKVIYKYKYDEKGNEIEQTLYQMKHKFGKEVKIPTVQTVSEYEFYPEDSNSGGHHT